MAVHPEEPEENVKMLLANALRKMAVSKSKHSAAVKRIKWNEVEVAVEGYSKEELQDHLQEIIKMTSSVRTLDEILADFESNGNKYVVQSHPDYPTRPATGHIRYLKEQRQKLEREYQTLNPDKKMTYVRFDHFL